MLLQMGFVDTEIDRAREACNGLMQAAAERLFAERDAAATAVTGFV